MDLRKRNFILITCAVGAATIFAWYFVNDGFVQLPDISSISKSDEECVLPASDAWDPKITQHLDRVSNPLENCVPTLELLTELSNGQLRLTRKLKDTFWTEEVCEYRAMIATGESKMRLNNWTVLTKTEVELDDDLIEVQCRVNGRTNYANMHIQARKKLGQKFVTESANNPSVFFFVLDSTSMSSGMRSLQQTQYVLQKFYKANPFWHLNKVGDNSRPNAKALFVGERQEAVQYGDKKLPPEISDDCHKFLDKSKSLYELFKNATYATFAGDDWSTPFAWPNCIAFDGVPTTHYARPIILRTTGEGGQQSDVSRFDDYIIKRQCKVKTDLIMEHLSRFLETYEGTAKFAVIWLSGLFHDYLNGLYHYDKRISEFFRENRRLLANSFIFFMGDHGFRFGPARKTEAGEFENNNPMLVLSLPEYLSNNSELSNILRTNSRRHISHFDIYTTVFDIMKVAKLNEYRNFTRHDFRNELGEMQGGRSMSILRPIDSDRSCQQMEIARQYCICTEKWNTVYNMPYADEKKLAKKIAESINLRITLLGGSVYCAELLPKTPIRLIIRQFLKQSKLFKVQITVSPSDGQFEVYVRLGQDNTWMLESDYIDRLDQYGSQGDCVLNLDATLRPLCFCLSGKVVAKPNNDSAPEI